MNAAESPLPEPQHRLLRASAGTGKTYQLVQAYCQLLQQGLRPAQIVVITFTRKAAAELRGRIREQLRRAAASPPLLAELGRAPISNFHGLALQLLRGFALQGGVADGTEVMGEAGEDAQLFCNACELAWFGGDSAAAAAVQLLAPHVDVDNELPLALWSAVSRAREEGVAPDRWFAAANGPAAQAAAHDCLLQLRQRLLAARGTLGGKAETQLENFAAMPPPLANAEIGPWAAAWRASYRCIDRRTKLKHIYDEADKQGIEACLEGAWGEVVSARLLPHLKYLCEQACAIYGQFKQQRRVMDFADIVERLVCLLNQAPAMHRELRERFAAVLVDEAQDTNPLQRQLVMLLAGLAGPVQGTPASLFVVGDRKQSIYTFRGADPKSFGLFAEDLRALGGTEQTLSVSRRSCAPLVQGINSLGYGLFGKDYEPLEPLQGATPEGRMTWYALPEEAQVQVAAADSVLATGPALEAAAIADFIGRRLDAGASPGDFAILLAAMTCAPRLAQALADAGIPVLFGGGGALHQQPEVVDALALLRWLWEPSDYLAAAVALRSPFIGLSDATLLLLLGGRPRALDSLLQDLPVPPDSPDAQTLRRLASWLPEWRLAAHRLGAAALLERLERDLSMDAVVLGLEGGPQRLANLHRLLRMAAASDAALGAHVGRFLRDQQGRAAAGSESLAAQPSSDRQAVVLSSVHQSKGLQYPVVILANLDSRGRHDTACLRYCTQGGILLRPRVAGANVRGSRWQAALAKAQQLQADELRRLLYVAVTRAEREVVFIAPAQMSTAGFAELLIPWAVGAKESGHLTQECAPTKMALAPQRQAVPSTPQPSLVHAPAAIDTKHVEVTVTELSRDRAGPSHVGQPDAQSFASALYPTNLDPLDRGRLAHTVLANLERSVSYRDVAAFVHAELLAAGYDTSVDAQVGAIQADVEAFLNSTLGQLLRSLPAECRRPELPFSLTVGEQGGTVALRGQIDLLYWDAEGPVVVDYKHAHATADLTSYYLQLDAYALAVSHLCHIKTDIRTQLIFLRDRAPPHAHLSTHARQAALRDRLVAWPNRPA